jgi:MFS family permease
MLTLGVYLLGSGRFGSGQRHGLDRLSLHHPLRCWHGHWWGIRSDPLRNRRADPAPLPRPDRPRSQRHILGRRGPGTLGTFILLNVMDPSIGWRIGFLIGPVLGVVILLVRRRLPESPRWQVMNGREQAAEESISYIEHEVEQSGRTLPPVDQAKAIELRPTDQIGYLALIRVLFREYPSRAVLGASLMISQSFLYNAIFFTYTLVLGTFYGVPSTSASLFLIAFAAGNLIGPLAIGHLFDTIGRKTMIAGTYITSGVLLGITAFFSTRACLPR